MNRCNPITTGEPQLAGNRHLLAFFSRSCAGSCQHFRFGTALQSHFADLGIAFFRIALADALIDVFFLPHTFYKLHPLRTVISLYYFHFLITSFAHLFCCYKSSSVNIL